MKRRHLLSYAALGGATATLAACQTQVSTTVGGSTAQGRPRVEWQMATSWPTSLDALYGTAEYFAERVSVMTEGRFTIQPYAAGELVPGLQVLDAVQAGTVQCGHTAAYYYTGKNPAFAFGTALPFGLTAQQQNAWLYEGGGRDALNQIYGDFNALSFTAGNTGVQMGGWFKREVKTPADLKGLKMRIPGLGGQVLSRLGVNVQVLPGGEVFLALDRGVVDAAEWVGPYDDEKLGLHNAADFYYYPGWWEPGSSFDLVINQSAWQQLPLDYQQIIEVAAADSNVRCLGRYDRRNPEALDRLVAGGTQLKAFSPEILAACEKEAFALFEEIAADSASFKAIYDPWQQFRQSIYRWHAVSELAFSTFALNSKS